MDVRNEILHPIRNDSVLCNLGWFFSLYSPEQLSLKQWNLKCCKRIFLLLSPLYRISFNSKENTNPLVWVWKLELELECENIEELLLNLVKLNQIWIVITLLRLIWNKTKFNCMSNQSKKYNHKTKYGVIQQDSETQLSGRI